ncbi:MAG: cell division protein FtsQ [Alphaproteobacteria bacterium]|jgi:cell division protein FtsQ
MAEKCLSLLPNFNMPSFSVRRRHRIRSIAAFCLWFIFPAVIFITGYNYVQQRGGFLQALSSFAQLQLQQVNLTVYQGDNQASSVDWHVDPELIKAALPVSVGEAMLDINPDDIRRSISELPWVKSASVKLILPSTLSISIKEQRPFALWQRDEIFYLIDENGAEITNQNLERYDYLPWVVGYGANTRIYEYAALMNDYQDIFQYVKSAYRVGNRRWTLVTENEIEISLSENNPRASLEQLMKLQKQRDILNQDIMAIDLRISGKTFVRQKDSATLSVYSGANT